MLAMALVVGLGQGVIASNAAITYVEPLTNRTLIVTTSGGMWMHRTPDLKQTSDSELQPCGARIQAINMTTITSGSTTKTLIYGKNKITGTTGYVLYSEAYCYLTSTSADTVQTYASKVVYVNAKSGVYIHAGDSLYSSKIGSLLYGQTAQLVSKTNLWAKVLFVNDNNRAEYGYVYLGGGYVTLKSVNTSIDGSAGQSAEKATKMSNGVAIVTYKGNINVHASASCESVVKTKLGYGSVVKAIAKTPHWVYVTFIKNGVTYTGYIYRSYSSLKTGKTVSSPASLSVMLSDTLLSASATN